MIGIAGILKEFTPVGLKEMQGVKFMNRIDTKYLFSVSKLQSLLQNIASGYQVLEIDGQREFSYKTVYFDTPELLFLYQHLTGKLSRYKVRVRTYETNGLTFLEVKHKSNKGRTSKTRILKDDSARDDEQKRQEFLNALLTPDTLSLKPVIATGFNRITITSGDGTERITIDFNLSFNDFSGNLTKLPFLAIAEIKRDKSHSHSDFVQQLKKMGLHQSSFSKYCVGMALLNDIPKKNSLKPKLLLLNKIKNEYDRNGVA
jgi:hypothetical protein